MDFPVNPLSLLVAAFVPVLLSYLWYSPMLFGKAQEGGALSAGQQALSLFVRLLFGFFLAFSLATTVVHQTHLFSLLADVDPEEAKLFLEPAMAKYGNLYRSFGHGVLHAVMAALFFALPVLVFSAIGEGRKLRSQLVHLGFLVLSMAIMGGIICAWV